MVTIQTDRKAQQGVENVDSLFASIEHYYQIPHKHKSCDSEHNISFGRHPIREHRIYFSPFRGGFTNLRLNDIDSRYIKSILGYTCDEMKTRINENRDVAKEFDAQFKAHFKTDRVSLEIDTYQLAKANVTINIEMLDNEILDIVSELLKHTGLLPKAQSTRQYEL